MAGLLEGDRKFADRFAIERIEFFGAVDRDPAHRAAIVDLHVPEGHSVNPWATRARIISGLKTASAGAGSGSTRQHGVALAAAPALG
ncbi:MAG TPA: hypothetical protein VF132_08710 [Rudaea sp.]